MTRIVQIIIALCVAYHVQTSLHVTQTFNDINDALTIVNDR